MCELYGFSGNRKKELNHELREFYSHASKHPNGWGLALFSQQVTKIMREAKRADQSDTLRELLYEPIAVETALAHIRLATIGNVEDENCHPFVGTDSSGRSWTLIHNGTVFEDDRLNKYVLLQKGETDSERIQLLISTFPDSGFEEYTEHKNAAYLRLAQGMTEYGWILNLLLSASPVCDGSFFDSQRLGETVVTDYASLRCGKDGYWNHFTPILQYDNILSYAESIQKYLNDHTLAGAGELYYPIRLKPKGANRLNNLVQNGVNHIELRNIDINPFADEGLDVRDLQFIELLCLWIFAVYHDQLTEASQIRSVENFKLGALLDIDNTFLLTTNGQLINFREAGLHVLNRMTDFYKGNEKALDLLIYQQKKLQTHGARYAERVIDTFGNRYVHKGLAFFPHSRTSPAFLPF